MWLGCAGGVKTPSRGKTVSPFSGKERGSAFSAHALSNMASWRLAARYGHSPCVVPFPSREWDSRRLNEKAKGKRKKKGSGFTCGIGRLNTRDSSVASSIIVQGCDCGALCRGVTCVVLVDLMYSEQKEWGFPRWQISQRMGLPPVDEEAQVRDQDACVTKTNRRRID